LIRLEGAQDERFWVYEFRVESLIDRIGSVVLSKICDEPLTESTFGTRETESDSKRQGKGLYSEVKLVYFTD
jgi:hypothetical protein